MTDENVKNHPRYPLERRGVMTPENDEVATVAPVQGGADERSGVFHTAHKDDMTSPRNPFGSAFRRNRQNNEII